MNPPGNAKGDWSAVPIPGYFYLGYEKDIGGAWAAWWYGIAKPSGAGWAALAGADQVIDFWWTATYSVTSNNSGKLNAASTVKTSDRSGGAAVNMAVMTGREYDTGHDWTMYPPFGTAGDYGDGKLYVFADMPKVLTLYGCPYKAGVGPVDNMSQAYYFLTGLNVRMSQPNGGDISANQIMKIRGAFQDVRCRVFNPVVNSISKTRVKPAGGDALVLTGLGFLNDGTEITNAANNANSSAPPGGWNDRVDQIDFIGTAGEGTYSITRTSGPYVVPGAIGYYVIDSNSQITIASMPAMPIGSYKIKLTKQSIPSITAPSAYAGDWAADPGSGFMSQGNRIILRVGGGGKRRPLPGVEWEWPIKKYYAPIDMRAPARFYDGRIINLSNFTRSVSSGIGTSLGSDADIKLSNVDKEFSRLLFQYYAINLGVAAYYIWSDEAEAGKALMAKFIVDDYTLQGPTFAAKLRDVGSKYFQKKLPEYRCTAAEFPNIYEKAINAPKPDVLGTFSFTATDKPGAIVAPCVDTVNHIYLAARGSLYAVDEVYSAGVLKTDGADYSVSYDGLGQTLITFSGSQGDNDVTYNGKGYSWPAWDSANGYVQNPAYILEYFLTFLVGVPVAHIDTAAFTTLAAFFTAGGYEQSGKLALTTEAGCDEYFRQLLYTFGVFAAFTAGGKWTVARKDYASLAMFKTVWAQLDTLDHPSREYVTNEAFNRIRAAWDLVPNGGSYQGGATFTDPSSLTVLGAVMEPQQAPAYPWTDSAAWIAVRAAEDLRRFGFGDNKFRFQLSIDWLDEIDILENLKLQDLFGVDPAGAGEAGRFIYIESLTVDPERMVIDVTCSDLTWILSEFFILGSTAIHENWADAGPEERVYGYLSDGGAFADGAFGKSL